MLRAVIARPNPLIAPHSPHRNHRKMFSHIDLRLYRQSFKTLNNRPQALAAAPLADYLAKASGNKFALTPPASGMLHVNRISCQTMEVHPRHFKLAFAF
jgi:hypothetical protein